MSENPGEIIEIMEDQPFRHQVHGLPLDKAMELFGTLCGWGFACSIKHMGGWYFIEVPVGLRGDPCFHQTPKVQTLAFNAGCKTIQTGHTLRVIG